MSQAILVKGTQEGLTVAIPDGDAFDEVCAALEAHLQRTGEFFRGASVTLDVGSRALSREELGRLLAILTDREMVLAALNATHPFTRAVAGGMGIELPSVEEAALSPPARPLPEQSWDALLVRRTLRSGQSVQHPGAIIVLGDVNPGAEVVAGGDVVVWGALRGLVHAGALGDEGALVCALTLEPTQLRIAHHITISPESQVPRKRRFWQWQRAQNGPEVARVQEDTIVVKPGLPTTK